MSLQIMLHQMFSGRTCVCPPSLMSVVKPGCRLSAHLSLQPASSLCYFVWAIGSEMSDPIFPIPIPFHLLCSLFLSLQFKHTLCKVLCTKLAPKKVVSFRNCCSCCSCVAARPCWQQHFSLCAPATILEMWLCLI